MGTELEAHLLLFYIHYHKTDADSDRGSKERNAVSM